MADISTYLQRIMNAVYGEEVRGSIHDALAAINTESENASQSASEAKDFVREYSEKPPIPNESTKTWWIWNETIESYVDSNIGTELEGPQGTGISSIVLISGDHSPGSSDVYEIQLTDGTSYTFSVFNGQNGEGSGDVSGISFDIVLETSKWNDNEIAIIDSRFISSSIYKYYISANSSSRSEYLSRHINPNDITSNGKITFSCETTPTTDLSINVVRLELSSD